MQGLSPSKRKTLGKTVVRLRMEAKLTQECLAELAEINVRFLQKIEKGEFGASLPVLIRLKRSIKCTWDELLIGLDSFR